MHSELLIKVRQILENEQTAVEEIGQYLSDVRDGLSATMSACNRASTLMLVLIATHYLSTSGLGADVTLLGVDFPDNPIIQTFILLFTALIFLRVMSLSYLRKFQREVYDWGKVLHYRKIKCELGSTGLHELRLPSDPLLGADLLKFDDGLLEKIVGTIVWNILSFMYVLLPTIYILHYSIESAKHFATQSNTLGLIAAIGSLILLFIVWVVYSFHAKLR